MKDLNSSTIHSSHGVREETTHHPSMHFSRMDPSSEDELDNDMPAADALLRFRDSDEPSEYTTEERRQSREVIKLPQESLHSFQFSATKTNRMDLLDSFKCTAGRPREFVKYPIFTKRRMSGDPLRQCSSHVSLEEYARVKSKSVVHSPVTSLGILEGQRLRRRSIPATIFQIAEDDVEHDEEDQGEEQEQCQGEKDDPPSHTLDPPDGSLFKAPPESVEGLPSAGSSSLSLNLSDTSSTRPSTVESHVNEMEHHDLKDSMDDHRMPPSAIFPHPTLHNPSRFLPQNQAILTTYDDWHIILSNNIAAFVLVGDAGCDKSLVGKSVLDFIDPSFRTRFQDMVHKRRQELNYLNEDSLAGGMVLVCGNVLPIVKQDGSKSAASLWLKEKRNDAGKSVYIWVFEEVFESLVHVTIDTDGIIRYVDEGVQEVYDYTPSELVGQSIQVLIPSFDLEQPLRDWQENQYFGGRTKRGANFPIIAKMHMMSTSKTDSGAAAISSLRSAIRITSIPMIAGLVTVRQNGIIVGCNNVFVQYMFGFSQEELITGQLHIATLMPQFPTLLRNLQRDDLLQHGFIINSAICRKLIADTHIDDSRLSYLAPSSSPSAPHTTSTQTTAREPRLTHAPNGQALPVILAIHRDGTPFEVQLQLRLVDGSDDALALWITFNRDATFARFGHTAYARPSLELKQHNGLGFPTIRRDDIKEYSTALPTFAAVNEEPTPSPPPRFAKMDPFASETVAPSYDPSLSSLSSSLSSSSLSSPSPSAPSTPQAMRVITNNVYRANREPLFSPVSPTASNHVTAFPTYSAQTQTASIDDYHILDDLGEGAYGLVKLAVRKNDPEKKKVVIKYVIKSRILVDCWTRDRKLGTIPAEIHILHTLRKIPHPHCAAMIDYFEDDDHYYIIMPLHGDGMDLFDYIELKPHMAEFEIKSIFRQVADAVRHLHDHSIVHRDIKDENVILDGAGAVRLIDFGSAAYMKAGRRFDTFFGTLEFSSPEVLRGHTYEGPPQDVWALGILLYTLICRENPFYDVDEIMGGELRWPTFEVSKDAQGLIRQMLNRTVEERPDIHAVLAHPWLS